jgi:hypothetical protein
MRKGLTCALLFLALTGISCDESFSPKGEYEQKYFLFCIINYDKGGATVQYAIVNGSYDVAGTSPLENTVDPSVDSAIVRLTTQTKTYVLSETSLRLPDTSRYGARRKFYLSRAVNVAPGEAVTVTASIPKGPTLVGSTAVPVIRPMESHPTYVVGFTTTVNRNTQGDTYILDWDDGNHDDHLYFPTLTLMYTRTDGDSVKSFAKPIPMKFVTQNGQSVPVYPTPGPTASCSFSFDAIDAAIRSISEGDSLKSRYTLLRLDFQVIECDLQLSRYYLSVNGTMDQYSLRLDETVYSNVQGGGGIVGATLVNGITYPIDPRYASQFGYRAQPSR